MFRRSGAVDFFTYKLIELRDQTRGIGICGTMDGLAQ